MNEARATERRARRVYGALVWLAGRGQVPPERAARLRAWAERLGLADHAACEVEAEARAARSLRVGRDAAERALLRRAAWDLARDDDALARSAAALLRRVASAHPAGRPGPFEESDVGPPLLRVAPRCPAGMLESGRALAR